MSNSSSAKAAVGYQYLVLINRNNKKSRHQLSTDSCKNIPFYTSPSFDAAIYFLFVTNKVPIITSRRVHIKSHESYSQSLNNAKVIKFKSCIKLKSLWIFAMGLRIILRNLKIDLSYRQHWMKLNHNTNNRVDVPGCKYIFGPFQCSF
jgi:hypothetical protein